MKLIQENIHQQTSHLHFHVVPSREFDETYFYTTFLVRQPSATQTTSQCFTQYKIEIKIYIDFKNIGRFC